MVVSDAAAAAAAELFGGRGGWGGAFRGGQCHGRSGLHGEEVGLGSVSGLAAGGPLRGPGLPTGRGRQAGGHLCRLGPLLQELIEL